MYHGSLDRIEYYYKVDNSEYICRIDLYGDASIVKKVKVHYKKSNPEECQVEYLEADGSIRMIALYIPTTFLLFCLVGVLVIISRDIKIKKLIKNGLLVKNIPVYYYSMSLIKSYFRPIADFTFPNGKKYKFKGNWMDKKPEDNAVDLVYYPKNPRKYCLDFNINRIEDINRNSINNKR